MWFPQWFIPFTIFYKKDKVRATLHLKILSLIHIRNLSLPYTPKRTQAPNPSPKILTAIIKP